MCLVCVQHRRPWKKCDCGPATGAWIYTTKKERSYYIETGLIPNLKAELCRYEGGPIPEPIPLVHPPQYDFKVD